MQKKRPEFLTKQWFLFQDIAQLCIAQMILGFAHA